MENEEMQDINEELLTDFNNIPHGVVCDHEWDIEDLDEEDSQSFEYCKLCGVRRMK